MKKDFKSIMNEKRRYRGLDHTSDSVINDLSSLGSVKKKNPLWVR